MRWTIDNLHDKALREKETFKKIMSENEERLPLLTLDEFFEGNTAEDSIAPNDWGYGFLILLQTVCSGWFSLICNFVGLMKE